MTPHSPEAPAPALAPCPFCGGAPAISTYQTDEDGNEGWAVACDCRNALESQPYAERYASAHGSSRSEAIAAWNKRAALPGAAVDAEALRALGVLWRAEADTADERSDEIGRLGGYDWHIDAAIETERADTLRACADALEALAGQAAKEER